MDGTFSLFLQFFTAGGLDMSKKNPESMPLYQQLAQILKEEIHSGKYKQGEKMPTELEMCEIYRVSRDTVRGALQQLEKENLLVRQQGKGTFVSKKKYTHHIVPARSFTDMCLENGSVPGAKVIKSVIKDATEEDIAFLQLAPGAKIIAIERIRYTDGVPVELEISHFPEQFDFLLEEDLNHCSMLALLREKYGVWFTKSRISLELTFASYEISHYLSVQKDYPLILISSEMSDQNGKPGCRCVQYVVGDKFKMVL